VTKRLTCVYSIRLPSRHWLLEGCASTMRRWTYSSMESRRRSRFHMKEGQRSFQNSKSPSSSIILLVSLRTTAPSSVSVSLKYTQDTRRYVSQCGAYLVDTCYCDLSQQHSSSSSKYSETSKFYQLAQLHIFRKYESLHDVDTSRAADSHIRSL